MSQITTTLNREELSQLSTEDLVEIILTQQATIKSLSEEIERLKISRDLDSKNSSKPPSSDLLKKSEKKKEAEKEKRKPQRTCPHVGQVGYQGKTRKGFAKVDRVEILTALSLTISLMKRSPGNYSFFSTNAHLNKGRA